MKYAVAINEQPVSGPPSVFDFVYQQKENLHVWKGTFATTMKELAAQVNAASEMLRVMGADAIFITLRVVEVEGISPEEESKIKSLMQANEELRDIVYGRKAA